MLKISLICPLSCAKIFVEMAEIKAGIGKHFTDLLAQKSTLPEILQILLWTGI